MESTEPVTLEEFNSGLVEFLGKCTPFLRLPPSTIEGVIAKGYETALKSNDTLLVGTKGLGFLNVILSGQVRVNYSGTSLYGGQAELGDGRSFGSIDAVLGIGQFAQVTALADSKFFSVHRSELRQLLEDFPDFKAHLSHLRTAIAVRTAEAYQKRLAGASDRSISPNQRIAPRFSVWERNVGIQLSTGEVWKVENLSVSGLFIVGKPPGPVGTSLSFTLKPGIKSLPGVALTGTVTRADAQGFGISIVGVAEKDKIHWEEVVLNAMSLEIAEIFRPDLTKLAKPVSTYLTAGPSVQNCEILSIGLDGAIVRLKKGAPKGEFVITINLTLLDEARVTLNAVSKVMAARGDEFLVQFTTITAVEEGWIRQFLAAQNETVAPAKTVEAKAEKKTGLEVIGVENQQELNNLFIRELSNNTVILYSNLKHAAGDTVRIRIKLNFTPRTEAAARTEFDLSGSVRQVSQGNAIVELDASCLAVISALKRAVNNSNRRGLEQEFQKQAEVEHDTEHRRPVQLVLIVVLLGVFIWWTIDKIFSN